MQSAGFPGGPVVKNPPANAEDTSSIPGSVRSHMQQGNFPQWVCTPRAHSLQQEKPPLRGVHALQLASSLHSPQLVEKAHMQQWRPSAVKTTTKCKVKLEDSRRTSPFLNKLEKKSHNNHQKISILPVKCSPRRLSVKFLDQCLAYSN